MVDKSDTRVRKMFGEIAPSYDRMNHVLSMNVDRYWRWRTVRTLGPKKGDRILDVCSGTGDLAFSFARANRKQCRVIGADFCLEMLEYGEKKRARRNLSNVKFVQADTQHLPFPNDAFDLVTVAFGLRNVADTDQGLAEMTRVTKPGGQVAVLEFSKPRRQPIKSLYGFYFARILPRIGQLFARNQSEAYKYLPESVGEFPCYEALAERMTQNGLSDVRFKPLTFGVATLYFGRKPATESMSETDRVTSSAHRPPDDSTEVDAEEEGFATSATTSSIS